MNCKKSWNNDFMHNYFTKKFINNDLKKHRENVLFDREKSLLPSTQVYVVQFIKNKEISTKLKQLRIFKSNKKEELIKTYNNNNDEWLLKRDKIRKIEEELIIAQNDIKYYSDVLYFNHHNNIKEDRKQFIRACPVNDCRGFLSTQWKCELCHNWVCPDCNDIKGSSNNNEHICKIENIETCKLLAKDSKPCPSCASLIFKISGCNQMFCIVCKKGFDWKTGKIETGPIHNPEYFNYLQQLNNGVVPVNNQLQCNQIPNLYEYKNHLRKIKCSVSNITFFCELMRVYLHNNHVVLPHYIINIYDDNRNIRINYMINAIDENTFKIQLQMKEKARLKKQDIYILLEMYQNIILDSIIKIYHLKKNDEEIINNIIIEINNLITYCNNILFKIKNKYNCVVPNINSKYIINNKK
jgi:hypothetical protein